MAGMQTNNWKWAKLGDIAEIIGGVSFDKADVQSEGIRILRGGNIQSGKIIHRSDDVFLPATYADCNNQVQYGDTVLVASTGSVEVLGKAATCFTEMKHCQIGAFLRIVRPKEAKYAMLVSCYLTSSYFSAYIQKQAKGTSINNIRNEHLKDFKVLVPNDEDLASFSAFYKNIESKLLLNRQINDNLEAMAKQLYDYWFVQFDFPNEEGKPYKSSGGKMAWNEKLKREIPEGWYADNICRIADILSGGTPSKQIDSYWQNGNIPFFGPTDYAGAIFQLNTAEHITSDGLKHCASSLFEEGVVIITARGSIGKLVMVGTPMAMNQSCYAFRSRNNEFEYLYFLTAQLIEHLKAKGSGSVFKSIITTDIENSILSIADETTIALFTSTIRPLMNAIKENTKQIEVLTKQRDELLPLLMNGQVSVNYHLSDD